MTARILALVLAAGFQSRQRVIGDWAALQGETMAKALIGRLAVSAILISPASLTAQSEAENVATREQARVVAIQTGRSISSFYASGYFGINGDGSTENFERVSTQVERPVVRLDSTFTVRVYRVAALVTGVQWIGTPAVAHRFLRVWSRSGEDAWRIAASQLTPIIGEASGGTPPRRVRSVVGPVRSNNPPCRGAKAALDADQGLNEALGQRNLDAYAALTAPEFLHVDGAGRAVQREEFLRAPTISPIARGRQFKACDLIVLFPRREGDSGVGGGDLTELEVRVLAVVNGVWRQVATQRTPVSGRSSP